MSEKARIAAVIAAYVLYIPVMFSLIGVSIWLFKATEAAENPVLEMLWFFLRVTPGIIGFTGLACGGVVAAAYHDSRASKD